MNDEHWLDLYPAPTLEEIAARRAEIQAGWTDAVRMERAGRKYRPLRFQPLATPRELREHLPHE